MNRAVGVAVLVVLGGLAAVPPAGATPETACQNVEPDGPVVVATLPGDAESTVYADDLDLYPETTVSLVLCDGGEPVPPEDGQRWHLGESPALTDPVAADGRWRVEIAPSGERVAVPSLIEGESVEAGVRIRVVTGAEVESGLDGVGTLAFRGESNASRYADRESAYLASGADVADGTAEIETLAGTIRSEGLDPETHDEAVATLKGLDADHDRMRSEGRATRRLLFDAAFARGPGAEDRLDAMAASERREGEAESSVDEALRTYSEAVERERASPAGELRRYMLPGAIVGLLAGALAGVWVVGRKGREFDHFVEIDGSSSYDASVLFGPLLVGLLLAVLGVSLAVYGGGWSAVVPAGFPVGVVG